MNTDNTKLHVKILSVKCLNYFITLTKLKFVKVMVPWQQHFYIHLHLIEK